MVSPVEVCNLSLLAIGAQAQISSLTEDSTEANACAMLYQQKMDSLFRAANWNCARRQEYLTLLKAANGTPENPSGVLPKPPQPWLYEYALPDDCLKARSILPFYNLNDEGIPFTTGNTLAPIYIPDVGVKFIIGVDKDDRNNLRKCLLTNQRQAQLVYTARINDPTMWDAHFLDAAIALLAAFLVNPLNRNAQLMHDQFSVCKDIVTQARISDGNEGFTSIDHDPDWMRVRGSQGPIGFGFAGAGWDSLGGPSGLSV